MKSELLKRILAIMLGMVIGLVIAIPIFKMGYNLHSEPIQKAQGDTLVYTPIKDSMPLSMHPSKPIRMRDTASLETRTKIITDIIRLRSAYSHAREKEQEYELMYYKSNGENRFKYLHDIWSKKRADLAKEAIKAEALNDSLTIQ